MNRLVHPEILDSLPPADPRAVHSRRDLHRINWWMRNHMLLARALREHAPEAPRAVTELGAGDGRFLLRLAGEMATAWPEVRATLLDREPVVARETLTALQQLGWRPEVVQADVFDWAPATPPEPVVIANLFLHHFEDEALARLLLTISQQTDLFIALEPRRVSQPWICGQLLRLIGCNDVTLHDGVVSVRAGFAGRELSALWPDATNWQLAERRVGLFSHLFVAQRRR